jgi:hypothetical protein
MKRVLIVALSLISMQTNATELPTAYVGSQIVELTRSKCRYNSQLKEAIITDPDKNVIQKCYWLGSTDVYFNTLDEPLWWIPKSKFKPKESLH